MGLPPVTPHAAGASPRRLFAYNAGFWRTPRLRRILQLAGYDLTLGLPSRQDAVAVWGRSPFARRGEAVARRSGTDLIRVEDAFLRSVRPGRSGDAPLGLLIDPIGVHFDGDRPSMLEQILATADLNDSNLLARATAGIARLKSLDLSKYNIHDAALPCPALGYVLLVDQTRGDASLAGVGDAGFAAMLDVAQAENPGARIVVKSHPETNLNLRRGHFRPSADYTLLTAPLSPWRLLAGAAAVYTVSSQLGFEAILAGHSPRVFGLPFYAGWGLSQDQTPCPRRKDSRTRPLTPEQLFAAAMILAPTWYDPCRDQLCSFEAAVDQLEAEVRVWREDHAGHVALGMRMWKRGRLQAVFGRYKPLRFAQVAEPSVPSVLVWAGKEPEGLAAPMIRRVEDGFLRSKGLGADLIPPLSLVADDLGIYYDPNRESRLERLISAAPPTDTAAAMVNRARALRAAIVRAGLSKYNLGGAGSGGMGLPELPPGKRILVPGQVEDDASIKLGAGDIRTNLALIQAARAANPDGVLIYKPHPDVEAGLRPGKIDPKALAHLVNHIANHADPVALLDAVDEVWTITSLLGFEALLREKPVTCLGAPFFAGWGLTNDLGPVPPRRLWQPDGTPRNRPSLDLLVHATLISYPRYFDPVSRLPCPPEVILDRLREGTVPRPSAANRLLAKLQGKLASHAGLWR